MPRFHSFISSLLRGTLLNALLKSKYIRSVGMVFLAFLEIKGSKSYCRQDLPGMKPNWLGDRRG